MCIFISREMAWVRFPYRLRRNGAGKHAPWRDYVAGNMCRARWRLLHARRRLCNAGVWGYRIRLPGYRVGFVPAGCSPSKIPRRVRAGCCHAVGCAGKQVRCCMQRTAIDVPSATAVCCTPTDNVCPHPAASTQGLADCRLGGIAAGVCWTEKKGWTSDPQRLYRLLLLVNCGTTLYPLGSDHHPCPTPLLSGRGT